MKYPICGACIRGETLCKECNDKTRKEGIKKDEIEMYRLVNKHMKGEKHLKDAQIKRILTDGKFVVLVTDNDNIPKMIGKNGIIAKKLSKKIDKQVRVVSEESEIDQFTKEIFHSSTIIGVNIVYSPQGEIYRVRLPMSEKHILKLSPQSFMDMANTILGKKIEVVFE